MLKSVPKISVVMSVYNGEKYLREAIDSILNQTFADFELIIIDDGSTDKSANIIKSYGDPRIILIQQKNKGLAAALNTGIKAAKGKYIARMDADDISHTNRFELQIDYMENHKECVAIGTEAKIIDENGNYIYTNCNYLSKEELRNQLPESNPFVHGSMMIRKEKIKQCGGYKEDVPRYCDDIFLWIDLQKIGDLDILNNPLYYYRISPIGFSNVTNKLRKKLIECRLKYLRNGRTSYNDILDVQRISNAIKSDKKLKFSKYHLRVGSAYFANTDKRNIARKHFLKSIKYQILNVRAWFNLFMSLLPKSVIYRLRRFRVR